MSHRYINGTAGVSNAPQAISRVRELALRGRELPLRGRTELTLRVRAD
jgi:hypothetical protein